MKINKIYIPLLLSLAIAGGIFIGAKLNFKDTTQKIFATNSKKDKLNRLIDYIDYEYVDKVNTDSIVDVTVNEILENLDPHSVYIPADKYEENADDMRGNFVGIGISFYVYNDTIAVIRALDGGPAQKAGIKAGDRIIYADTVKLYGKTVSRDTIVKYLKGQIGSKVKLQVARHGENDLMEFTLKRDRIPLVSVDAAYQLTNSIGYIKINRFAESTIEEFDEALHNLIEKGISSLVVDLRDNPGGYISPAEEIADHFLTNNKTIVITRNKTGEEKKTLASSDGDFEEGRLYILVNENTASASEIVAGALQDNDRAVIIGRRTFGKGLVQREMSLGDGSAVRLTIARYYTPTGRSIQRPYGNGIDAYYNEYRRRYKNGELVHADSIKVADSLKFVTPQGKVVYGGGGIIPDVFIPKDTSLESETLEYVSRNGFVAYYVFEYLEKNRNDFINYQTEDFLKNYQVPDSVTEAFINYSRFNEAHLNMANHKDVLKRALKAHIAQQLFGIDAYEIIINEDDPMLKKVIELEKSNSSIQH